MRKKVQGFTLIELMIVMAIVGIIASIAIPLYTNYMIRAQVSEGINLVASAKVAATEYFQERGLLATSNVSVGLPAAGAISGNYVTQVELNGAGVIEITYGNRVHPDINGGVISMTPTTVSGSVRWDCTGDAVLINKYVPPTCRT